MFLWLQRHGRFNTGKVKGHLGLLGDYPVSIPLKWLNNIINLNYEDGFKGHKVGKINRPLST